MSPTATATRHHPRRRRGLAGDELAARPECRRPEVSGGRPPATAASCHVYFVDPPRVGKHRTLAAAPGRDDEEGPSWTNCLECRQETRACPARSLWNERASLDWADEPPEAPNLCTTDLVMLEACSRIAALPDSSSDLAAVSQGSPVIRRLLRSGAQWAPALARLWRLPHAICGAIQDRPSALPTFARLRRYVPIIELRSRRRIRGAGTVRFSCSVAAPRLVVFATVSTSAAGGGGVRKHPRRAPALVAIA